MSAYTGSTGSKIIRESYHDEFKLGNSFATLAPIFTTIGYVATRVFTNYNPIAGATFFGAALLGRLILEPYFHTESAWPQARILGGALNAALATFAAVKGTPYVQEGINFVASHLPSNMPSVSFPSMPSISMPSVSSAFAGIKETFANLSVESVKEAVVEHPFIAISVAALCVLFIARRAAGRSSHVVGYTDQRSNQYDKK